MISNVILKNGKYYVQDEKQKEISSKFDIAIGELMGFSSDLVVFLKNSKFYIYDENLKEISSKFDTNLG